MPSSASKANRQGRCQGSAYLLPNKFADDFNGDGKASRGTNRNVEDRGKTIVTGAGNHLRQSVRMPAR
jgi:hypothetical protein